MKELIAGILYANDDYMFYKPPYGEYWIQMRIHYGRRNTDAEKIPTASIACGHMHADDFCSYGERENE